MLPQKRGSIHFLPSDLFGIQFLAILLSCYIDYIFTCTIYYVLTQAGNSSMFKHDGNVSFANSQFFFTEALVREVEQTKRVFIDLFPRRHSAVRRTKTRFYRFFSPGGTLREVEQKLVFLDLFPRRHSAGGRNKRVVLDLFPRRHSAGGRNKQFSTKQQKQRFFFC